MARRIPTSTATEENLWLLMNHPVITFSLVVAWIAACVAIFATLCASCHRKSPRPVDEISPSSHPTSDESVGRTTETSAPVQQELQQDRPSSVSSSKVDAGIHGPIYPTSVPPSGSKRKLSISLSMGLPEGLNKIKTSFKSKERHGKGGEETLWKKPIILGDKCRLPNSNEEAVEEDNRTSVSRPNSPRSLPPSRTVSLAN